MDNRRTDQFASPRRRLLALVVPLAPLALGACTAYPRGPSAAAPREQVARAQGSAWETVLPTPDLARWRQAYAPWELPEYARRDGDIAVRSPRLATALDQWPDPTPTVVFPRYLTLPRHPDRVLIFVPVPVHGHRPRY